MKQNERILMYLVGGFLAVIMVIAVFVGNNADAAATDRSNEGARGLDAMFGDQGTPVGEGAVEPGATTDGAGEQKAADTGKVEQPLVASKPVPAAELVRQYLGESTRDRNVRIVTVEQGDYPGSIVQRWCGKLQPYLDEVKVLNEQMGAVLKVGQKISVPWVDDETVLAAYLAKQPRQPAVEPVDGGLAPAVAAEPQTMPSFQLPGGSGAGEVDPSGGPAAAPAGTKTHVVKSGESLWKIAADLYGRGKADKMVKEILALNPGATTDIKPDQKLIVPVAAQ